VYAGLVRAFAVVATALVLAPAAWAWPNASLEVTVWPKGKSGPSHTWTLRCDSRPRGTHPDPDGACFALARHPRALKLDPKSIECTDRWDGPELAFVRGKFRGQRVRAWFRRTNGCEISRWNALSALLPRS
jgi:Subtilisin inhibitor-like